MRISIILPALFTLALASSPAHATDTYDQIMTASKARFVDDVSRRCGVDIHHVSDADAPCVMSWIKWANYLGDITTLTPTENAVYSACLAKNWEVSTINLVGLIDCFADGSK